MKKISLLKLIENPAQRHPRIEGTEAKKFLEFLKNEDGRGNSERAWQQVFSEFNKKALSEFINELIQDGWICEELVNHLDIEMNLTNKGKELFD